MRILILSINYWPEMTGIGALTTERAEQLAASGHEVEVCTSFPYYPEWKVASAYRGRLAMSETRNGVRILRGAIYVPNRPTAIRRIAHEASFVLSATMRSLFRRRPAVLLVVSPPLGLAAAAILLSRLWRVPYVFDVEDLQPDAAIALGMLPRPGARLLYALERAAYRYARVVTTLTPAMRDRIVQKGVAAEKVELVEPCLPGAPLDPGREEAAAFRTRYGIGGKFLVSYSGNIGIKQKLDAVADAAHRNRNDDSILFLIVGDGADCGRIRRKAEDLKLNNLRLLPLLDEKEFRALLAATDICLITQQKCAEEIAFPSKLVTYLAAGRPVVASINPDGEAARVIRDSGAGRVTAAEDPDALLGAILALRGADLEAMGRRARAYAAARWSPRRVLEQLELALTTARPAALNLPREEVTR